MAKDSLINDDVKEIVIVGGLALAAYLVIVKPILNSLGVDPAAAIAVASINQATDLQNPFSPNFQDAQYQQNSSYPVQDADQSAAISAWEGFDPSVTPVCSTLRDAITIWNAVNWYDLDDNTVMSVIQAMPSQSYVSQVSQLIKLVKGVDLWTLLKNGNSFLPFASGMGQNNLGAIVENVQAKPLIVGNNVGSGCSYQSGSQVLIQP